MSEQQTQQKCEPGATSPIRPKDLTGGIMKEFRVILPITVEEYQVAQLYSVAEASKNETGGGEGIEVLKNEPITAENAPAKPLLGGEFTSGQYTHKIYHLQSKVPGWIRMLAPKGSLEIHEEAWNAYPYCRTIISNPTYMKEGFYIIIESYHLADRGDTVNAHRLSADEQKRTDSVVIDIAHDKLYSSSDYKEETDPRKFKSQKTGRGPLVDPNWQASCEPVMCAYKLVRTKFKWFGLQTRVEKFIMKQEQRLFTNFHREVFCWMDKWQGLTMQDIRALEDKTKEELDESRQKGSVRGTVAKDEKENKQ